MQVERPDAATAGSVIVLVAPAALEAMTNSDLAVTSPETTV